MSQMHAHANGYAYPSPPITGTYQDQIPYASSPPRRPEPEFEVAHRRPRRHSDNDIPIGLPSDFMDFSPYGDDDEQGDDFSNSPFFDNVSGVSSGASEAVYDDENEFLPKNPVGDLNVTTTSGSHTD